MRHSQYVVLATACTAATFAAACGGSSTDPPLAMEIAVFAGNGQTAIAGHAVATPPSVRVTNHFGLPQEGITIKFVVTSGNGVLDGDTQQTNTSGVATLRGWTLGSAVKIDSLLAKPVTSTGGAIDATPVLFTATAIAGAAVRR